MKTPKPQTLLAILLAIAILIILYLLLHPAPGLRITTLRHLDIPGSAPSATPAPLPADATLRIATYNIENFTDARRDGPLRTPALAAAQAAGAASVIAEADPDILLLQEIENPAALALLNAALPAPYPYAYITRYRASDLSAVRINEALLSRIPPSEVRQISFNRLPDGRRPTRGALSVRVPLAAGRDLLLYAIHLKSNYGIPPRNVAQRTIALHLLAADAAAERYRTSDHAALSVLMLGDTNVDPDTPEFASDPSLDALAGGYSDLWRGRPIDERTTLPTRHAGPDGDTNLVFRPAAFDRVFASRDLVTPPPYPDPALDPLLPPAPAYSVTPPRAIQRGCATNDNTLLPGQPPHISDHYLVYLDLLPSPTDGAPEKN